MIVDNLSAILSSMKNEQHERDWAQEECQRQGAADQVDNFLSAWDFAKRNDVYASENTENYVGEVHGYVVPAESREYRRTPVVFQNGNEGANWREIPRLMKQLAEMRVYSEDIYTFINEFLRIHPFDDGNGRTATIMLNAALGSRSRFVDPVLPDGWLDCAV